MNRYEDIARATMALLRAVFDGDEEGAEVIIASTSTDLDDLARVLASVVLHQMRQLAEAYGLDPDEWARGQFAAYLTALPQT